MYNLENDKYTKYSVWLLLSGKPFFLAYGTHAISLKANDSGFFFYSRWIKVFHIKQVSTAQILTEICILLYTFGKCIGSIRTIPTH